MIALILCLALNSVPADLDAEEKAFVGQCIDKMLNAKSERIRRGAEDALVSIGIDVVDELSAKSGDAAWKALEKICIRVGAQAAAERLVTLAGSTKDTTRKNRLTDLAAKLRSGVPGAKVDASLASKVNALLAPLRNATSFSSSDPVVDHLVDLGHDIVPILLTHLKPGYSGMVGSAVEAALKRLVEPDDLPILKDSLLRGHEDVAAAVGKLMSDGTKDALGVLHQAVERGIFGFDVAHALEGSPEPADTARVMVSWFKNRPNAAEQDVAAGALLLGKLEVFESAEVLVPWAAKAKDEQTVYQVGRALVLLGESKGIPLLIRIVAREGFEESRMSGWARPHAATELNRVSGKTLDAADERITGNVTVEQERKFAEAAKEYRKWWDSVKGRLKFDRSSRSWSVK